MKGLMKMKRLLTGAAIALLTLTAAAACHAGGPGINPGVNTNFPVGWVYSTLYARNALVEINTLQSRVSKEPIIVPDGPKAIAVDPRGRGEFLYVVCERANVVAVVDRRNRLTSRTISVGEKPYGIAITPDGRRAFVTNENAGTVSVIELTTQTVIDTIPLNTPTAAQPGQPQPTTPTNLRPQGVAVNWNGTQVFVACATGQVVMLEGTPTSRYSATRNILLSGSVSPQNIAVASDSQNTTVYVTDPQGNRLFFFSPAQGTQSAEVRDIQGSPWGVAVGRNPTTGRQDRLYVTARTGNALYPLTLPDLSTATSGGQGVSVEGKEPTYVAASPQGGEVYVALAGSNNIAVFRRVGGDLARPEVYQMQQLDPNFNAPTGDIGLAPFLSQ